MKRYLFVNGKPTYLYNWLIRHQDLYNKMERQTKRSERNDIYRKANL